MEVERNPFTVPEKADVLKFLNKHFGISFPIVTPAIFCNKDRPLQ